MAFGEEFAQFTLRLTLQTFNPCHVNRISGQFNLEGTMTGERGEGEVAATQYVESEARAKTGTWRQYGGATLKDGTFFSFQGEGTWEEIGVGKWRYRGTAQRSDGMPYAVEFEGDWATKTWAGKAYA